MLLSPSMVGSNGTWLKRTHGNCFVTLMTSHKHGVQPSPGNVPHRLHWGEGWWAAQEQSSTMDTAVDGPGFNSLLRGHAGVSQDSAWREHHERLPQGLAALARPKEDARDKPASHSHALNEEGWSPKQITDLTQVSGLSFSAIWLCP